MSQICIVASSLALLMHLGQSDFEIWKSAAKYSGWHGVSAEFSPSFLTNSSSRNNNIHVNYLQRKLSGDYVNCNTWNHRHITTCTPVLDKITKTTFIFNKIYLFITNKLRLIQCFLWYKITFCYCIYNRHSIEITHFSTSTKYFLRFVRIITCFH